LTGDRKAKGDFMSDMLDTRTSWLSDSDLESARERVPMVYVDAVPVRTDERGQVTTVGLLLRALPDGSISRAIVSGRVLYGERVRDALLRHLEKDLGPMALPQVPASPQPFTIVSTFPTHRSPASMTPGNTLFPSRTWSPSRATVLPRKMP